MPPDSASTRRAQLRPPDLPTSLLPNLPMLDPGADLAVCRGILAEGSKSFAAASKLLPRRLRDPVAGFYAFCRVADDAVDESDAPNRAVTMLQSRLDNAFAGQPENDPVDRTLCRIIESFELPRAPFDALLDGFLWDAQARRYPSFEDILAYSARVASAVGVIMTYLMGPRDALTLARACDLGAAMQLTNIARDVGEDARRGRIYLPLEWLAEANVDLAEFLARPRFSPELGGVVQRLLQEADKLYARARPGVARLPRDCRPAIRAAGSIYRDIGRLIERNGFDSVSSRARTSALRKLWLVVKAWSIRTDAPGEAGVPPLEAMRFLLPG